MLVGQSKHMVACYRVTSQEGQKLNQQAIIVHVYHPYGNANF